MSISSAPYTVSIEIFQRKEVKYGYETNTCPVRRTSFNLDTFTFIPNNKTGGNNL